MKKKATDNQLLASFIRINTYLLLHALGALSLALFLAGPLLVYLPIFLPPAETDKALTEGIKVAVQLPFTPFLEIFFIILPPLFRLASWLGSFLISQRGDQGSDQERERSQMTSRLHTLSILCMMLVVFGALFHLAQIGFVRNPTLVKRAQGFDYLATVSDNKNLANRCEKLDVAIWTKTQAKRYESFIGNRLQARRQKVQAEQNLHKIQDRVSQERISLADLEVELAFTCLLVKRFKNPSSVVISAPKRSQIMVLVACDIFKSTPIRVLYLVTMAASAFLVSYWLWKSLATLALTSCEKFQKSVAFIFSTLALLFLSLGATVIVYSPYIQL